MSARWIKPYALVVRIGELWRPISVRLARPVGLSTSVPGSKYSMAYLHQISFVIGLLGVLVIVFGVATGLVRLLRIEFLSARGRNVEDDRKHLRRALGYYLLLGLEFLIASDIIDTLVRPTLQDLATLGAIVLIRTVISYSLNAELKSEQPYKATTP
jgi:uncharacterized membrane protein